MHHDVVVIGGGQAGLAMGYHLARQGRGFVILDAAPRVGHVWRTRWDSLTLFTPARYSALPGLDFPAPPEHLPSKGEVADYLEQYARHFTLPVCSGEAVRALRPRGEGAGFEIETERGGYTANQVVIATGPFQRPRVPALATELSSEIVQMHSSEYRAPDQLPAGDVLVVGGGNSGVQIAAELAAARPANRTWLSIGERLPRLPQRLLGQSLFWWCERVGLMKISAATRLGRRMSGREHLIGESPAMLARRLGVRVVGRTERAEAQRVRTRDGAEIEPAAIVWATGFRPDYGWVEADVFDARGRPRHTRGVTEVPGLYFLGLPWQHTRGSALLGWVGRDAQWLAGRMGTK
jgi:putative flavoprotein involved in K+ transport